MAAYHAKKRLGQHFLTSDEIINQLTELIISEKPAQLVEVGPGQGALSEPLAQSGLEVLAVEFDADMLRYLNKRMRAFKNFKIVNADFLHFDPAEHGLTKFTLVGNLPYNITSPVMDWCVKHVNSIDCAFFMVQKEMADRISSKPGQKDWSPVAIFTQLCYSIKTEFDVPPSAFEPPPKVRSAVISMRPITPPKVENPDLFERVVRAGFKQRRKQLVNNLVSQLEAEPEKIKSLLADLAFKPNCRAEEISTDQFLQLTAELTLRNML